MQSKNGLTHTATATTRDRKPKVVTLSGDTAKNLVIMVDEKTTIIRNNSTTDKDLYEALCYEPFDRYVLEKGSHNGIRDEVFNEFYSLMERIVEEVNGINAREL